MPPSTDLPSVTCDPPVSPWLAGEWVPLTLRVDCPATQSAPLRLRDVDVNRRLAPFLQLDTDLLQRNIEVRPGESYKVTIPVRVPRPGQFNLSAIYADVGYAVPLHAAEIMVYPSLAAEVRLALEPVVPYDRGTKVRLTVEHQGATPFHDFEMRLGPENAVVAGKHLRRSEFTPGDRETCEAVVVPGELEVILSATTDAGRAEVRRRERIGNVPTRTQRPTFRFLEPRHLASDDVNVLSGEDRGAPPLPRQHGAFPLVGGGEYRIAIIPQSTQVTRVRLRDVPGAVRVLREAASADGRMWTFELEVTAARVLSKLERIVYDVDEPGRAASGEVVVRLDPTWHDQFQFAVTAGFAVTIQGVFSLAAVLADSDASLLSQLWTFTLFRDVPVFVFPFAIPLIWVATAAFNRVWCWLFV